MSRSEPLEDRSTWSAVGCCPVERAMEVIGSRAAMLIVREAFYGTTRFDDFVERVGIAPATAAARLRALNDAGLFERRQYQDAGSRPREEYVLTPAGEDLMPVLVALYRWGIKHLGAPHAIELVHADCGHALAAAVTCPEHLADQIGAHDLDARWVSTSV